MEASLFIFVPEELDLSYLNFEITNFEWDGISYPQGLPQAYIGEWGIEKTPILQHLIDALPSDVKKVKWVSLNIFGLGFEDYVSCLGYKEKEEVNNDQLVDVLNNILDYTEIWVAALIVNDYPIEKNIYVSKSDLPNEIQNQLYDQEGAFIIGSVT